MSAVIGLLGSFVISFGLLLIAMSAHEFSHGWMAYKLGDKTAKYSGRLTLNPLAHIDVVWTLIMPLFLFMTSGGRIIFGAAKPVPINYRALKNPKRDLIWVGLSGPAANFILAFLLALLARIAPQSAIVSYLLINLIVINVVLGVFNLIPLPPLDGSRVVMGLLPESLAVRYALIEPYGFIIIMLLSFSGIGIFSRIVFPVVQVILRLLGVIFLLEETRRIKTASKTGLLIPKFALGAIYRRYIADKIIHCKFCRSRLWRIPPEAERPPLAGLTPLAATSCGVAAQRADFANAKSGLRIELLRNSSKMAGKYG